MSEAEIIKAILECLDVATDGVYWRQNTGVVRVGGRYLRFGRPGCGDITGITKCGTRVEIEVKTKRGRMSKKQLEFKSMIEQREGIYILARSVDDLQGFGLF